MTRTHLDVRSPKKKLSRNRSVFGRTSPSTFDAGGHGLGRARSSASRSSRTTANWTTVKAVCGPIIRGNMASRAASGAAGSGAAAACDNRTTWGIVNSSVAVEQSAALRVIDGQRCVVMTSLRRSLKDARAAWCSSTCFCHCHKKTNPEQ